MSNVFNALNSYNKPNPYKPSNLHSDMPNKDKVINRATWKRWREKNRITDNKRIYKRKTEIKIWFKEFRKNLQCSKCPENHPACIDFHHKEGKEKKDLEIARMVQCGYSKERILKEIEKCDILCSNCHRKLHWG